MSNQLAAGAPLGNDRVLSVADVCDVMGFCPETATKFMRETGYALVIHRRVFILQSSLINYLHHQESRAEVER